MRRTGPDRSQPLAVIGLGNPGDEYIGSRHNVGFAVADLVADHLRKPEAGRATGAQLWSGSWKWRKAHVLKPMRFMNLSGEPVRLFLESMSMSPEQCLVVIDDLDLDSGSIRIRAGGSSGGHKGLEDIISALGTTKIPRCRIGIGHPGTSREVVDHVLDRPVGAEGALFERSLKRASESALCWLVEGVTNAARRYNGPLPEQAGEIPDGVEDS
ncbi:MAG: aminoacyl-tRNA hydrolase [Planctomycetota bacterium]|nr:aminoacyl-tRNA hydrolase [Planctomycetota bacterium]